MSDVKSKYKNINIQSKPQSYCSNVTKRTKRDHCGDRHWHGQDTGRRDEERQKQEEITHERMRHINGRMAEDGQTGMS